MGKRVYGLKRGTGRMKMVHMNHMLQEQEQLEEAQYKEAERKRQEREVSEINDEGDAIRRCILVEGEQSFYRWWNSDAVPTYGPRRERIEMIEKRILELNEHKGSVANEEQSGEKSE